MGVDLREEVTRLHAGVCKALADPNRILILYTLAEGPHNVTEITESLDLPQPTVSRHLKTLRQQLMVRTERQGQSIVYSLADERVVQALDLLRSFMADSLEDQMALTRNVAEDLAS